MVVWGTVDGRDRRDGSERRVRDRKEMNSRFLEHRRLVREEMDRNGAPSGLWMESPSPERRPTKEVSPPRSNTNHAKKEVSKRLRKRSLSPSSSSSSSSSSGSSDADSSSASEREEVVSKSRSTSKSKVDYGTETRDKKVSRKDKSSKDIKESRTIEKLSFSLSVFPVSFCFVQPFSSSPPQKKKRKKQRRRTNQPSSFLSTYSFLFFETCCTTYVWFTIVHSYDFSFFQFFGDDR